MKYTLYTLASVVFCAAACSNVEDASPTDRMSFMRFYSSGSDFQSAVAEVDPEGGYILGVNIPLQNENYNAYIIKTDSKGAKVWDKVIENSTVSAILPHDNGYLILGDSIETNEVEIISELVNTRARLFYMDNLGNIGPNQFLKRKTFPRNSFPGDDVKLEVDYHGDALSLDASGNILVLGSFKVPGENTRSFVTAVNPSNLSGPELWNQEYGLLDRDYINCNSLFTTTGSKLVWASKTLRQAQNLSEQYVSVSYVEPNSTFENNSLFGETQERNHSTEDIQKSSLGYGIIGTYADRDNTLANIFFLRVDASGNIIKGSERYFDGASDNILLDDRNTSFTDDRGSALTYVSGGYVLAGTTASTPSKGAGSTDILLIKLDPFGNFVWSKLIGGTGEETASSIRQTPDGGLLICGTNTINGLSSVMLIKTDANGELTN